ncbi:MAG: anhydro-N-acetylmuramic acid kinase [Pseudomonadota bacterium]|nr:anhydro-N-acetylmuramic acid kinase [Pseudomonadota bacterium]
MIGEPSKTGERRLKPVLAIGLMSGTSADGVDLALIRTDGQAFIETEGFHTESYDHALRQKIFDVLGRAGSPLEVELLVTKAHAIAIQRFLEEIEIKNSYDQPIDVIGFHGHTTLHRPAEGKTIQIGDGQHLANLTGINVVCNFRTNDVAHGGEGAPITPIFHSAIAQGLEKPLAVLNIGGVANVTWIGEGKNNFMAFDTGPGGGQLDEWTELLTGKRFDRDGELARSGKVDQDILRALLLNSFFDRYPPKSLDRIEFSIDPVRKLDAAGGAATLLEFTCEAILRAEEYFPAPIKSWLVTGGGRKNKFFLERLRTITQKPVLLAEEVGWNGDGVEAEAIAYLAVRSLFGLPYTFPETTGVDKPRSGGDFFRPDKKY